MKTTDELRKLDLAKLREELKQARIDLFKVKFPVKNKQAANTHEVNLHQKYVARILTVKNELEKAA